MNKIDFEAPVTISFCAQQGCFVQDIEEYSFENGILFQENESVFHDLMNDLQALFELNGVAYLTAPNVTIERAIQLFTHISSEKYPEVENVFAKLHTWAKKDPQNINIQIDNDIQDLYKEYSKDEKKEYVIAISFQEKKDFFDK